MAFVDSSLDSPLAQVAPSAEPAPDYLGPEDEAAEDEEEEDEPRTPKDREDAGSLEKALVEQIDDINLARYLDDQTLDQIGMDCVREYELDDNSRADWVQKGMKAMKFATQDGQPKEFPWPGASNVIFPLIGQAAMEFHARTYPAIIQGRKVVRGVVWGDDRGTPVTEDGKPDGQPIMEPAQPGPDGQPGQPQPVWLVEPGEKRKRADRISEYMSYELLTLIPEWEPQTDQAIFQMPVAGGFVRKTFRDPVAKRNKSRTVSLMNLVWNYHAPSFEGAARHTEKVLLYPSQITTLERTGDDGDGGAFLPLHYGPGGGGIGETYNYDTEVQSGDQADDDAPHLFLEQHRRLDLDDDGYAEPYTVTIHMRSAKVVRIVARYTEEGIKASDDGETIVEVEPDQQYTLYPFLPNIEGGSYPMGFGHMLQPLNAAINTTLNQMLDAGTLQNTGGGFVSDQLNIPSGQTLLGVGKFHRVNAKGQSIRDAVYPFDFKGASPTLFQLLGVLISSAKEIAALANVLTGDAAIANAPPTTILALIEQGMQVYTAIHKRIFRAMKGEFDKLYALNRKHLTKAARYQLGDEWREVSPDDFRLGGGVEPVADPKMTTDMQKLGRANLLMTFKGDPLIDQREIYHRMFEAAGLERIEDLWSKPNPQQAQMVEMEVARFTSEIKKAQATALKDQTQAYFNLARARAIASTQEENFIEHQLSMLRLQIEATNAATRAAEVDHKFHKTQMEAEGRDADRLAGGLGSDSPFPRIAAE